MPVLYSSCGWRSSKWKIEVEERNTGKVRMREKEIGGNGDVTGVKRYPRKVRVRKGVNEVPTIRIEKSPTTTIVIPRL